MEKEKFIFVGYRRFLRSDTVSNCYLKFDDKDTINMYIILSSTAKEFEEENYVIRLDEEVFDKLKNTRILENEKHEITQVFIELPDEIKRSIKNDYNHMIKNCRLGYEKASSYLKEDYKEMSRSIK